MSVVQLLQDLIRIPSVNPENEPGTDRTGEAEIAAVLRDWLGEIGAEVELEEIRPGRPNLIARFAPRDGRPRILFGPHLDTVGVGGMSIEPFAAHEREGRIHGRGASDTKGPMAAMLWALRQHADKLADLPVGLDFVGFMGEESRQWGSLDFVEKHGSEYDFAIVGEPTSLHVVHATKGSLWATLRATGRSAHSSQPDKGDNAVMKLVHALHKLEPALAERLRSFTHPVLGHSTINLGAINGGTRPNIVPAGAEAILDIRTTPSLLAAGGARTLLEEMLRDQPLEITSARENPPLETPADHPWIERLLAVRPQTEAVGAPWFSDAGHLAQGGLPAICIGPGRIDQAHTVDEFIDIADLEEGARYFSDFIQSLSERAAAPQRQTAPLSQ